MPNDCAYYTPLPPLSRCRVDPRLLFLFLLLLLRLRSPPVRVRRRRLRRAPPPAAADQHARCHERVAAACPAPGHGLDFEISLFVFLCFQDRTRAASKLKRLRAPDVCRAWTTGACILLYDVLAAHSPDPRAAGRRSPARRKEKKTKRWPMGLEISNVGFTFAPALACRRAESYLPAADSSAAGDRKGDGREGVGRAWQTGIMDPFR